MLKPLLCFFALTGSLLAQPRPEVVARFFGPMPTGVTVSRSGRVFVNYPRWGDPVKFTVAEVVNGQARAYPSAKISTYDPHRAADTLVAVQSVVVDPRDRLWILDTGSIKFAPPVPGGAKLVGVDLHTNKVFKTIHFPAEVALPTTYLNDIRFDLRRNLAFITDSSQKGQNGIIVVNLESGESWRKLDRHPSVLPEPRFSPMVEGKPLYSKGSFLTMGADGIAISPDASRLYYCPLAARRWYSVSTDALADRNADAAATVRDEGDKTGASDGLETDAEGRLYATNYEHAAIVRRNSGGKFETLTTLDPKDWPDTLSVTDGWLYFTANQLQRQPAYQKGKDKRLKPYLLYRLAIPGAHRIKP